MSESDHAWVTAFDAAIALGVALRTVYRHANNHKLESRAADDGSLRVLVPIAPVASASSGSPAAERMARDLGVSVRTVYRRIERGELAPLASIPRSRGAHKSGGITVLQAAVALGVSLQTIHRRLRLRRLESYVDENGDRRVLISEGDRALASVRSSSLEREAIELGVSVRTLMRHRNGEIQKLPMRACVVCGNSYGPTDRRQVVCGSRECRKARQRESSRRRYADHRDDIRRRRRDKREEDSQRRAAVALQVGMAKVVRILKTKGYDDVK